MNSALETSACRRASAWSVLIGFLVCTATAYLLAAGTLLASLRPHTSSSGCQRTLTFAERVAYQRAIEEVYWRHRIWPKENSQPKPPLQAIVSPAQLEKKVEDYLRKSQLVADKRRWPIAASELQAEMERMASHTLHPRVLLELFQALANDPFVIAECLARPLVAERLATELRGLGDVEAFAAANAKTLTAATAVTSKSYKLPQSSVPLDSIVDTWTPTTTVNAPEARETRTAVWTGSEMIIWGGSTSHPGGLNTGGRYDPATDTWMATTNNNAPTGRGGQSAVWTGSELIIWGGFDGNVLNTGGRYNPVVDSWTATTTTNAPVARDTHTAVWTGSEMIIWGGSGINVNFNSGGRYNPATDSWTTTSIVNAPAARWNHRAAWTGSEMIVWGGSDSMNYLHTGGRYDPSTDSWTATSTVNAPTGRTWHTGLWTDGEMIVWGGVDETFIDSNTGGRYNPSTDSWVATNPNNAPSPRDSHTAVWTGVEMIVWGGEFGPPAVSLDSGGRYSLGSDSWIPTTILNVPHARDSHTAVWSGNEMIIWGGHYWVSGNWIYLNTGGAYCARSGSTPTPTPTATTTAIPTPTLTPTTTPSSPTPTATATVTPTPSSTPQATPTPRIAPTPRNRPTPPPHP
jgi:N-acetylneuraminic acid mutarotase